MNVLCIDVGNTRVHAGVLSGGRVLSQCAVPTPQAADAAAGLGPRLAELARGPNAPTGIALCSVVPKVTAALQPILAATGWPLFHLTADICPKLGLPLDYPNPAQIGQDRLALAFGTLAYHGAPAVAIDLGTAVTFDVLNKQGAYAGGIIAPGLGLMTRYLHEQTALLPELDPNDLISSAGIGTSTVEAMKIGCSTGFAGMIRAILDRLLAELKRRGEGEVCVVATGGSAGQLPKAWLGEIHFDPDLLLRGLEESWKRKQTA
ncbi:MAG TPA: type III pantothenate kinase [Verrucomicrobiae bacterium]|nr:type III pantothenate kinase [Verrucomicrobiae bacterium]